MRQLKSGMAENYENLRNNEANHQNLAEIIFSRFVQNLVTI